MARFRKVTNQLYWSSCPSRSILDKIENEKIDIVVNLTHECVNYRLPSSVILIHYPIVDFSFVPPEEVLVSLLLELSNKLEENMRILIHCLGGIGRSGTLVAMLLVYHYNFDANKALEKVYNLGGGPESNIQKLVFKWFYRNLNLFGKKAYTEIIKYLYTEGFLKDLESLSTIANISIDILELLYPRYITDKFLLRIAYLIGLLYRTPLEKVYELAKKDKSFYKGYFLKVASLLHEFYKEDISSRDISLSYKIIYASISLAEAFLDVYDGYSNYQDNSLRDNVLTIYGVPRRMVEFKKSAEFFNSLLGLEIKLRPYNFVFF